MGEATRLKWSNQMLLAIITVVAAACSSMSIRTAAGAGRRIIAPNCRVEQQLGMKACGSLLINNNGVLSPSPECCVRIRVSHPICVCPLVTPEIAPFLNPKSIKELVQKCGRRLPSRFKCGSIIIP